MQPEHIANIITALGSLKPRPNRLLVQVPAGLKQRAVELVEALESDGYSVTLAADDCYGACDLPFVAAHACNADAILHIGHVQFYKPIKSDVPVVYYEWPIDMVIDEKKLGKEIGKIKESKIGIVSSVQYLHLLEEITKIFQAHDKTVMIGGHVLGCWAKNAEALTSSVDALLFVGSGMFHPHGFECDYFFNLERGEISDVRSDIVKWEKIRWGRIFKARDARTFAILVSTKPGQLDMTVAENVKKKLEHAGKKAFILVLNHISDAALQGIAVDAFVNTACPRLADDQWSKPFVNATDTEKIVDE